jgi:hypothetical protein
MFQRQFILTVTKTADVSDRCYGTSLSVLNGATNFVLPTLFIMTLVLKYHLGSAKYKGLSL